MTARLSADEIRSIILRAMENFNLARESDSQMSIHDDAPLFSRDSPLDSLGLVSLLIDIEEGLQDHGVDIRLSDERAMSQKNSPFRTVSSLVEHIQKLCGETV